MLPVNFEGATEIKKPEDMTDEQCSSIWAKYGLSALRTIYNSHGQIPIPPGLFQEIDAGGFPYFVTAWKPSKEDLDALNRGEPIYIKTIASGLPPMALYTFDEQGNLNA